MACAAVGNTLDSQALFDAWKMSKETMIPDAGAEEINRTLLEIRDINGCLSEKMADPRNLGALRGEIATAIAGIEADREAMEIAKARVTYMDAARRPVSHYESWFPIGRPLKPFMIPLLMGLTSFLVILGLFLLLSMFGLSVTGQKTPIMNPTLLWLTSFGWPFWIVLVLLVAVSSAYLGTAVTYFRR